MKHTNGTGSKSAPKQLKKHGKSAATVLQQGAAHRAADARQYGRSRVSNAAARGSIVWLDNADKRGPVPRRFRDIVTEVTSDLASGPSQLSEGQRQLIRRIASLSVWCESQEAKMADGVDINILEFQRVTGALRRLCESIGLERRSRDVSVPTLSEYIASRHRQTEDAELEDVEK